MASTVTYPLGTDGNITSSLLSNASTAFDTNIVTTVRQASSMTPLQGTKGGESISEDDSSDNFVHNQMTMGLMAGFGFCVVFVILVCICWKMFGVFCGDKSSKNKIGPMDLRAKKGTEKDQQNEEGGIKHAANMGLDVSQAERYKMADHTTVTSSHGQFSMLEGRGSDRNPKSSRVYESDSESSEHEMHEVRRNGYVRPSGNASQFGNQGNSRGFRTSSCGFGQNSSVGFRSRGASSGEQASVAAETDLSQLKKAKSNQQKSFQTVDLRF